MHLINRKLKKILKYLLELISRIIYYLIPREYRQLYKKTYPLDTDLSKLIYENTQKENFEHFKEYFKISVLFHDTNEMREYVIKKAIDNDTEQRNYYLEFGVFNGSSANFFSRHIKKLYAFDSFQGLREDWLGKNKSKGCFSTGGKIPKLNSNIVPVVGFVQDTLDDFLKEHNPKINFIHFDMDTYPSTKYALERVKNYLVKGAVILFDELYSYPGWKNGEYKALKEVLKDDEYIFMAFNITSKPVAIKIK